MRKRDSQRQRVYNMGSALPPGRTLTLDEIAGLVLWAWQQYGMTGTPRITDGRRRSGAVYKYDGTIAMPRWSRNERIALHEAAHSIIDKSGIRFNVAAHGPEYARVYTDLIVRRKLATASEVRAAAKVNRVRIARARPGLPKMVGVRNAAKLLRIRAEIAEHERAIETLRQQYGLLKKSA